MVYGRVIGNELRDVPPEYLPIWGQRWSGYRAPHGPSPFSTRVFSVDRMSEMGPALTSPTQFDVTLTEEDEAEDASSESSQFRSFFLSSPLAIQTDATEPASLAETPIPRSVHRLSNHSRDSHSLLHWGTRDSQSQSAACFSTTSFPKRQSAQSRTQHHAEPILHPPALRGIPIQGGHESPENEWTLRDMGCPSTNIQLQDGHSPRSGQLRHIMSPHSIPEWQLSFARSQSLAYPIQLNPSSDPNNSRLSLPYQVDDQASLVSTTFPSSSHCFTMPVTRQYASSWDHESSMNSQHPMMPSWPQWSTLPDPALPWPLQSSGPPPSPEMFYHLVSDRHGKS